MTKRRSSAPGAVWERVGPDSRSVGANRCRRVWLLRPCEEAGVAVAGVARALSLCGENVTDCLWGIWPQDCVRPGSKFGSDGSRNASGFCPENEQIELAWGASSGAAPIGVTFPVLWKLPVDSPAESGTSRHAHNGGGAGRDGQHSPHSHVYLPCLATPSRRQPRADGTTVGGRVVKPLAGRTPGDLRDASSKHGFRPILGEGPRLTSSPRRISRCARPGRNRLNSEDAPGKLAGRSQGSPLREQPVADAPVVDDHVTGPGRLELAAEARRMGVHRPGPDPVGADAPDVAEQLGSSANTRLGSLASLAASSNSRPVSSTARRRQACRAGWSTKKKKKKKKRLTGGAP